MTEVRVPAGPTPPLVAVVLPVHNRKETTLACLRSLARASAERYRSRVVVVDDGSTDGTAEVVAREFPEVILLPGDGSLWWTGGVNRGIRHALTLGADYVLVLNDDTEHAPDFLERLVETARRHPRSLVGALVLLREAPTRVMYAGARWDPRALVRWTYPEGGRDVAEVPGDVWEVEALNGNCTLIPREVFEEAGLYDGEVFPHALADVELSVRAARRGWRLLVDPAARVWNHANEVPPPIHEWSWREIRRVLWTERRDCSNLFTRTHLFWRTAPNRREAILASLQAWGVAGARVLFRLLLPRRVARRVRRRGLVAGAGGPVAS